MKHQCLMLALSFFGVVGGSNPSFSSDVVCDNQGCISVSQFSTNISNALNNNAVGYVAYVGSVLTFGGQARTAEDPPATAMLWDLPTQVASLSKVLTTIGVLQSLAGHNLTIDAKISPYLWPDWQLGPNIDQISFKDLLTQRSGFYNQTYPSTTASCPDSDLTYSGLQQLIASGVMVASNIGTKQNYDNCNFAIFRELLPFMEGWTYNLNWSASDRASASADFYVNYMNQNVFTPLGIFGADCLSLPAGNSMILSYPFPAGTASGEALGNDRLSCGGGGWVLSAGDLNNLLTDLVGGNVLLANAQKWQMNYDCLGWDCSVRDDCPYPYVCKNGSYDLNNTSTPGLWTYLGIFKCAVPVVVVVNSQIQALPTNDIVGLVENAYRAAAVNPVPPGAPEPTCPFPLFTLGTNSLSIAPGQTNVGVIGQAAITIWPDPNSINVIIADLPYGVTATWTQTRGFIPPVSPLTGVIDFSASPTAAIGTSDALITASSGGVSFTTPLKLTVGGVCHPQTACNEGQCGNVDNGCSGILHCGGCPKGTTCSSTLNVCVSPNRCPPGTHSCGNGICTKYVCQ